MSIALWVVLIGAVVFFWSVCAIAKRDEEAMEFERLEMERRKTCPAVVIYGPPGSGKTECAQKLQKRFSDDGIVGGGPFGNVEILDGIPDHACEVLFNKRVAEEMPVIAVFQGTPEQSVISRATQVFNMN